MKKLIVSILIAWLLSFGFYSVAFAINPSVEKKGPATASVGVNYNYTVKAHNQDSVPQRLQINDTLDSSLTFVSVTVVENNTGQTVNCTYVSADHRVNCRTNNNIPAGTKWKVSIVVTPTTAKTVTNTAIMDWSGGNASSTVNTVIS